ncbi:hypothetical protein V2J09_022988 [Rumex salicifolius]
MASINIKYDEEFITNKSGSKLFSCSWLPQDQEPKALILLLHGYAMDTTISMKGTATRLANAGYGVYGMDYIGHGRSDGLPGYVPDIDQLVDDLTTHYSNVCEREENRNKKRFLMGESMGGAMVLLLHRKKPDFWDGAVLIAPMCKFADNMKPGPIAVTVFSGLAKLVPTWRLPASQDIIEAAVRSNPYFYKDPPRLKTAQLLYNITVDLESRLHEVTLPFLVVHGGDDKVTDPAVSKLLYDTSASTDKTFKLYEGMWHALSYGELPENIDIVFKDIISWVDERLAANANANAAANANANAAQAKAS